MAYHFKNNNNDEKNGNFGCFVALIIGGIIIYAIAQTKTGLNIIGIISLVLFVGLFIGAIFKK